MSQSELGGKRPLGSVRNCGIMRSAPPAEPRRTAEGPMPHRGIPASRQPTCCTAAQITLHLHWSELLHRRKKPGTRSAPLPTQSATRPPGHPSQSCPAPGRTGHPAPGPGAPGEATAPPVPGPNARTKTNQHDAPGPGIGWAPGQHGPIGRVSRRGTCRTCRNGTAGQSR